MRATIAILLLCWAMPLGAQDVQSDALRTEARAAFDIGRRALERGDISAGIAMLERSLDLLPYLPTAYNLAVAHVEGGDPSRAANLARAILAGDFGSLERRERREAEALLERAADLSARVSVRIEGATTPWMQVDGTSTAVNADRVATVYVPPGRHVFTVGADGVRAHRVALRLDAGDYEELRIDLGAPPRGTLRVRSEDDADPVAIMGVAEGPSPLEQTVPVGMYEVGLLGDPDSRRNVRVVADRVATVLVERPPRRWPRVVGGLAAALVVVGAALAIGFAVGGSSDGSPEDDPVFGTIEALRLR